MTKQQIHQIAYGFLREACEVLGMDVSAVRVQLAELPDVPVELLPEEAMPKGMAGALAGKKAIPMTIMPAPGGGVVVNERMVEECLDKESSTPVRMMMYTAAYAAFTPNSTPEEQTAFATALSLVKGIQPGDNSAIALLGEDKITAMVSRYFHLDCEIKKAQCEDGSWRYVLRVIKDNNPHQPLPKIKIQVDYEQAPKGTEDNPFENVDEAATYIKQQEAKEWAADAYLQELTDSLYYYEQPHNFFRIGWASPYVAFYKNEIPDDGFVVNQLASRRFSIKPNLYRHKFLFRGQSSYFDKCYPNLFREEKENFLDDLIWSQELQALVASHPLVQYCERGIELLHDRFVFEMNYGGLTQHYYNRSPFLDLTSDIESAKFFAVTDYVKETDEYIVTKNTGLGVLYYYSIEMPGAFRGEGDTALSTIGKQVFMRSGAQHGFLLRMEKGVNFNALPEVRKVFFKQDAAISQRIFEASDNGLTYFPHDALQAACREHLEVLKKNNIVSTKAVKINLRLNPKETKDSIVSQLAAKGIRVDDTLAPAFPKEHLTREAIVQMWDTFCDGVYFYTPDSLLYQEAMRGKRDEVARLV